LGVYAINMTIPRLPKLAVRATVKTEMNLFEDYSTVNHRFF